MKWWKISLVVLLAAVMVILAACGEKEMTKVKVGEVTRSIFYDHNTLRFPMDILKKKDWK